MRRPRTSAARRAIELFDRAPRADRVHVRVRWWTCPFDRVEAQVPLAGSILEVGSGHGLLSLYLALSAPSRHVLGVDIDERKVAIARAAADELRPGEADVRFDLASPDALPEGPFDAIVIADVLYLLGDKDRRTLVERCAAALADHGVLLVKETDHRVRWKSVLTTAQERLATRVGITAGDAVDFAGTDELVALLREHDLDVSEVPMHRGYLHPHHLLVGRRSSNGGFGAADGPQ